MGILALVAAIGVARWNWRSDLAPYSRRTNPFDVLRRPSRYTEARAAGAVAALARLGAASLIVAVAALAVELARLAR